MGERLDDTDRDLVIQALEERYYEMRPRARYALELDRTAPEGPELTCRMSSPEDPETLELRVRVALTDTPRLGAEERVHLALDAIGWILDQHLVEDPGVLPPLDWAPLELGGARVWFRGDLRNEALEARADAILAEAKSEDPGP